MSLRDFRRDALTALTLKEEFKIKKDAIPDIKKDSFSLLFYVTQCFRKRPEKQEYVLNGPIDYKGK